MSHMRFETKDTRTQVSEGVKQEFSKVFQIFWNPHEMFSWKLERDFPTDFGDDI